MKYLTLKNMERACKLLTDKGWPLKQANDIALNAFALSSEYGGPVELYLSKIIPYEEELKRPDGNYQMLDIELRLEK